MTTNIALRVALLGAAAIALVLGVARLVTQPEVRTGSGSPETMLPWLVAAALVCVAALAVRRQPTMAWLATIGALVVLTIDLASLARGLRETLPTDTWRWLAVLIATSAVLTAVAAVAYAVSRWRPPTRAVLAAATAAIAIVTVAGIWALATSSDVASATSVAADTTSSPLGSLTVVTRTFLVVTGLAVVVGIWVDLRPAVRQADTQVAIGRSATLSPGDRLRVAPAWTRALIDALRPGRSRAHQAAIDERRRLARDLHADVVPPIRHALALAEAGATSDRLATALRDALLEVESVGAKRHPMPLEVGGLVPAVEWLAERTQERSDVTIELDIAEADVSIGPTPTAGEPPLSVAASAFRVAALALDNAARHAPGAHVSVTIAAAADHLAMSIADDGPGIADTDRSAAAAAGRRGLADMTAEAASCGATLAIDSPAGRGTRITFDWLATPA